MTIVISNSVKLDCFLGMKFNPQAITNSQNLMPYGQRSMYSVKVDALETLMGEIEQT